MWYKIEDDRLVLKPLRVLATIGWVAIAFSVLMPFVMALLLTKGNFSALDASVFASMLLELPVFTGAIICLLIARRRVVFDLGEKTVVQYSWWKKLKVIPLEEVGRISLHANAWLGYRLREKRNRFGKGLLISPVFYSVTDPKKKIFEEKILPWLEHFLEETLQPSVPAPTSQLHLGVLKFYRSQDNEYQLQQHAWKKYLPGIIFTGLAFLFGIYCLLNRNENGRAATYAAIPLLILLSVASRRIVIDRRSQQLVVKRFGLVFARHSFTRFNGFRVVRRLNYGIYAGTEVHVQFLKEQGGVADFAIAGFHDTKPIQDFLEETEYLIRQGVVSH